KKMLYHPFKIFFFLFTGIILFISCNSVNQNDLRIFRYSETTVISSLDPAFAKNQANIWLIHQIYNTLVETDQHAKIIPSLAKSWKISEDKKEVIFKIRGDVYFHDHPAFLNGKRRKVTAHDVVYSFKRIMDPRVASPGAWIFQGRIDSITPFKAINDTVFVIKLNRPFVQILGVLSNKYCSIVPKEAVEFREVSFRQNPCGSGPFRFFKWQEGQKIILKKNIHYFESDSTGTRLPFLDGIEVSLLQNKASEFLEFRQKKFDFINDIDPNFKDELLYKNGKLRKEWEGKVILHTGPYLNIEYLGILMQGNHADSLLQIKAFRQAINYGIDRKKLMMYLRNSIGKPAEQGFIPSGIMGYDSAAQYGYHYAPQKAIKLLNDAGIVSIHKKPVIRISTVPAYADLAVFISTELKNIGIGVKVDVIPKSLLLSQMANQQVSFFRGSWIADYPDAENFMGVFYSKNPSPPNYTRYHNPEFDHLYEKCQIVIDQKERANIYRQMDSIVMQDAPVVPLWYDQVIHLIQPNIIGFHPHPLNLLELRRVRKW
ncbi:MAG: ABC transporter substrate-binding protein, partial [Bacteroidota bacterium]